MAPGTAGQAGLVPDLGIREFWQLDPLGMLPAPVVGYRLRGAIYERIPASPSGGVPSDVLGVELFVDGDNLRFRDRKTDKVMPDHSQARRAQRAAEAARRAAEEEWERKVVARRAAEAARHDAEERLRRMASARRKAERRVAELEQQLRQKP